MKIIKEGKRKQQKSHTVIAAFIHKRTDSHEFEHICPLAHALFHYLLILLKQQHVSQSLQPLFLGVCCQFKREQRNSSSTILNKGRV